MCYVIVFVHTDRQGKITLEGQYWMSSVLERMGIWADINCFQYQVSSCPDREKGVVNNRKMIYQVP